MPAPLDRAAEQQAIRALAAGSEEAASLLIEHNLRLVAHIVKKMCSKMQIGGQNGPKLKLEVTYTNFNGK